ncbi:MAG TPA: AAA family ATPase, partial [Acidimicrobiales bacterium]|nr:AAA family ATPase [Acidimicrobiales bacterium]
MIPVPAAAGPGGDGVGGPDPFDRRRARGASGVLAAFNGAGVLDAADVHVALRLGALGGEADEAVLLGAALAVRALRLGHVCTDLAAVRDTVTSDLAGPEELQALPWPDGDGWGRRLAGSPVVAAGDADPPTAPLRLVGRRLYLDRYWRQECEVAADLVARSRAPVPGVSAPVLDGGLARLFGAAEVGGGPDLQRLAAAVAVGRRVSVIGGGPGTGKTTTVARVLALLHDQAAAGGSPPPRVALAAPTGKAAARLEEAVRGEAARIDVDEATRDRLLRLEGSTLHRLLGWRPDSRSRFRHHRGNRLPHDVVVVDETSMVSLSLMAKLVEAVRPSARLVLVGDPEQLASVEAGAVLGDIVGPAATGAAPAAGAPAGSIGDCIVVLRRVHRYGGGIAELASAVQRGDADGAMAVLAGHRPDVEWLPADLAGPGSARAMEPVRRAVAEAGAAVVDGARRGDGTSALA